ncbi:Na+/H+ antiporter subunit E [Alkalibacterium sp. MB6]|uniref:Na+/H+ antiporter subunit E n=1 Tax=Alkalibacterium sp. MB6 TaxID=2081965 RepID=UPI00137AA5EB|nr:Na+/H+ antiporter subunit E [Alkalibacterium sp. MB6]
MKSILRTIWKDFLENKEVIILLTVVWIILFEEVSLYTLISGFIASFLVIEFTDRFLLKGNYEHSYAIGLGTLIKYTGRLLWEIIVAGISVIPSIITGKADVQIIKETTKLTDELLIDLLANAITLTPGSVTVDKKGSELNVLALNPEYDEENGTANLLPGALEDILFAYEKKIDGKA